MFGVLKTGTPVKKILLLEILILVFIIVLLIDTQHFPNNLEGTTTIVENIVANTSKARTKYILYWNTFASGLKYTMGLGSVAFKNCRYKNCYITNDRTELPLDKFDLIIFYIRKYNKSNDEVPTMRLPHQRYMFVNSEAPTNVRLDLKHFENYFNWTMSYRFDSDFVTRYGFVRKAKTSYSSLSREFIRKKTKLAAWFVSNCDTSSKRENLTREIQKYIPVDVYGECGRMKCKRISNKISSRACYDMVEKNYKFYFSFENSYCKDYSTEKLYYVLQRNIVPVVYGGGDYKIQAPPYSVINVADFKNVKELVNYLKYLHQNDEEYMKYFEWKKNYRIVRSSIACTVCEKLHKPVKQSIYGNIDKWWNGEGQSVCKTANGLPEIMLDVV